MISEPSKASPAGSKNQPLARSMGGGFSEPRRTGRMWPVVLSLPMIEVGEASENDMILAFLRAEIDSPRHGDVCRDWMKSLEIDRSMCIGNPDLNSEADNSARMDLLGRLRGYGADMFLFEGFPADTRWRRVKLEPPEHARLKYAKEEIWPGFSDGTRSVVRCAEKMERNELPNDPAKHLRAVQENLETGETVPEIIAVEGQGEDLILVEGFVRATAYVASRVKHGIDMFLGSSRTMDRWKRY